MNYEQKYSKYKLKYLNFKGQIGGRENFYFITEDEDEDEFKIIDTDTKLKFDLLKQQGKIIESPTEIRYDGKLIYNKTTDEHYIKTTSTFGGFSTNTFELEIFISNNFNKIKLNIKKIKGKLINDLLHIEFNNISPLNKNFKGDYIITNIHLSDYQKTKIIEELNLDPSTAFPPTANPYFVMTKFNININFNNFKNFKYQCLELFCKTPNISTFKELREIVKKELVNNRQACMEDKRFIEFITSHYLHKIYNENALDLAMTYYLLSVSGFGILSRILTDTIKKNTIITDTLCSNKLLYYENSIKYIRTNINLDEVLIKNSSGAFVNLPPTIGNTTNINITLDTGNDSYSVIGIVLLEYLGFNIRNYTACTTSTRGIGGRITYNYKFQLTIKFVYYKKEFTFDCLVDQNPRSVNYNSLLFGWTGILTILTNKGYALYEKN
jgi:hypothetical protein